MNRRARVTLGAVTALAIVAATATWIGVRGNPEVRPQPLANPGTVGQANQLPAELPTLTARISIFTEPTPEVGARLIEVATGLSFQLTHELGSAQFSGDSRWLFFDEGWAGPEPATYRLDLAHPEQAPLWV